MNLSATDLSTPTVLRFPLTVAEAAANCAAGWAVIAGGTVAAPAVFSGVLSPAGMPVIDLGSLSDLAKLQFEVSTWRIGALVTVDRLCGLAEPALSALRNAATGFGNPNIRRQATVGGNIGWLAGPGDLLVPLIALEAEVVLHSGSAPKSVAAADARGLLEERHYLITEVTIPVPSGRTSAFARFALRHASARSLVSFAVAVDWQSGTADRVRCAVGGAVGHPRPCVAAAHVLEGTALGVNQIETAARTVGEFIDGALMPSQRAAALHLSSIGVSVARLALHALARPVA
jgi:CO/xanthine dehydrogenase FAD-binding subunit